MYTDSLAFQRTKLMNRKQTETESVTEFANSIRDLVGRAFPDSQQFTRSMRNKLEVECRSAIVNSQIIIRKSE